MDRGKTVIHFEFFINKQIWQTFPQCGFDSAIFGLLVNCSTTHPKSHIESCGRQGDVEISGSINDSMVKETDKPEMAGKPPGGNLLLLENFCYNFFVPILSTLPTFCTGEKN